MTDLSPGLSRAFLDAVLRRDLVHFADIAFRELNSGAALKESWHHRAIAAALQDVYEGRTKRLLITMPPRSLKSHLVSVAGPAWLCGHDPTQKVLTVSHGIDLAVSFGNQWRQLVLAPWYRRVFGNTAIKGKKNKESEAHLTRGGYRLNFGANGPITGRGADLIIVDDPMKAQDAHSNTERLKLSRWFDETLVSRLNDKQNGAIIVVMQRLHIDDLAAHLLEKGGWKHLDLPAIAPCNMAVELGRGEVFQFVEGMALQPEREPHPVLDQLKADMGRGAFSAQYLQNPVPFEGNVIKIGDFGRDAPGCSTSDPTDDTTFLSVDCAGGTSETSDYTVVQTWRTIDGQLFLIDQRRGRWVYPELKAQVMEESKKHGEPRILIENASSGISLIQELKKERGFAPISIKPDGNKLQRLDQALPMIESGKVHLPKSAPWLDAFETETKSFPGVKHDDQVDAMTQAINWHRDKYRRPFKIPDIRLMS